MTKTAIDEVLRRHPLPFELRPDQYKACCDLSDSPRAGLYAEVGVGKTVMATVLALAWNADVNLVILPPILFLSWSRWLASIGDCGGVLLYRGAPAQRKAFSWQGVRWVLLTMQVFKLDFVHIEKQVRKLSRTLIVDEATSVKNFKSDSHKKVAVLAQGNNLQLLTGTPLSTPHDAFAYVKLISPGLYRSKGQFDNLHVEKVDFFGNVSEWKNLALMQENLLKNSVRLLKEDVLKDLSRPNYIPIEYDLAPAHLALYNKLAEEQLLLLDTGGKIDATTAGKLYNALQQIVVNWDYFSGDENAASAALDIVDRVIDQAGVLSAKNSKLIIYTYFRRTSAKLLQYLQDCGAVGCYSEISPRRQEENLDAFLSDPATRILVAQPMSGGVGFNPQAVCSEVLFIESPSVPWHFTQGVGRIYRGGQKKVPNVHLGIANKTIQVLLHRRLLSQDALVNQVQLSYQDLRAAIYG